jgi:hypothetical protein
MKSLFKKLSDTRLASPKKHSLLTVNEHFEGERNAVGENFWVGSN